jgi:hypothetical protein
LPSISTTRGDRRTLGATALPAVVVVLVLVLVLVLMVSPSVSAGTSGRPSSVSRPRIVHDPSFEGVGRASGR